MAEYITRKAVFEQFDNGEADVIEMYPDGSVDFGFGASNIRDLINAIPAAYVAPVVHGRWVHSRYENCSEQFELVKCSQCDHEAYAMAFYVHCGNYCPNCGARMDGGADNAETD